MKPSLALFCLGILITSCTNGLKVQTNYLSRKNLASYHVNTPDPDLNKPLVGQRILVQWRLPYWIENCDNPHILLRLRFGNKTDGERIIPIKSSIGHYVFTLLDEEYWANDGIESYQAILYANGDILEKCTHRLWVELIQIGKEQEESLDEN